MLNKYSLKKHRKIRKSHPRRKEINCWKPLM